MVGAIETQQPRRALPPSMRRTSDPRRERGSVVGLNVVKSIATMLILTWSAKAWWIVRLKFKRAQIRLLLAPWPRGITTKKEEEEDRVAGTLINRVIACRVCSLKSMVITLTVDRLWPLAAKCKIPALHQILRWATTVHRQTTSSLLATISFSLALAQFQHQLGTRNSGSRSESTRAGSLLTWMTTKIWIIWTWSKSSRDWIAIAPRNKPARSMEDLKKLRPKQSSWLKTTDSICSLRSLSSVPRHTGSATVRLLLKS